MKIIISEQQFESIFVGKRVMVYYNLNKHTFSILYQNKIIMYADFVKLGDVEFRVRKGGKEKVRDEKRKNVHAFVIGTLLDSCEYPCEHIPIPKTELVATYDPYRFDSFVIKGTSEPIFEAKEVELINSKNKIYITEL